MENIRIGNPDATDAVLVVDPDTGYLYHVGPGPGVQSEVWLYIP